MRFIIEFLKRFAPMLRSGKMSYGDALRRFKAQYGKAAEGMEKAAIMKEVEKAPSNVIQFPSGGVHNVPVDQQFTPPGSREIFEVLDDDAYQALKGDYYRRLLTNTDDDVKAFAKRVIANKQDVKLERLTKDQRKDMLTMIDDRIKMGNRKFMNEYDSKFPVDEDFASGGIARVGFNKGKEGELFGIPWEDIKEYQEKKRRGEIIDRTSPLAIPDDWLERFLRKFRKTETYEQPMASGGIARVGFKNG